MVQMAGHSSECIDKAFRVAPFDEHIKNNHNHDPTDIQNSCLGLFPEDSDLSIDDLLYESSISKLERSMLKRKIIKGRQRYSINLAKTDERCWTAAGLLHDPHATTLSLSEVYKYELHFSTSVRPFLGKLLQHTLANHADRIYTFNIKPEHASKLSDKDMEQHATSAKNMTTDQPEFIAKNQKRWHKIHLNQNQHIAEINNCPIAQLETEKRMGKHLLPHNNLTKVAKTAREDLATIANVPGDFDLYWNSIPVPACIIMRCLLHWNAFTVCKHGAKKPQVKFDRSWLLVAVIKSLADLSIIYASSLAVICFCINNGLMLLHFTMSLREIAVREQLMPCSPLALYQCTNLHISRDLYLSSALGEYKSIIDEWQPYEPAATSQHPLEYFGHSLHDWLNTAIQTVMNRLLLVFNALPLTDILELESSDWLVDSQSLEAIMDGYTDMHNVLLKCRLLHSVRNQMLCVFFTMLNNFFFDQVISNRSLCTMLSGMRLQMLCSAMADTALRCGGHELEAIANHSLSHCRQLALVLLLDKQVIERKLTESNRSNENEKLQSSHKSLIIDALNPAQLYHVMSDYHAMQTVSQNIDDPVPKSLLKLLKKKCEIFCKTKYGVSSDSAAHAGSLSISNCVYLSLDWEPQINLLVDPGVGRFFLSSVAVPHELSIDPDFSFLRMNDNLAL